MDENSIKQAVQERVKKEAEALAAAEKKKNKAAGRDQRDGEITPQFVRNCLLPDANYSGDAWMYKELTRDDIIFNKTMGCHMVNKGSHWDVAYMNEAEAAVERIIPHYASEIAYCGQIMGKIVQSNEDNTDEQQKSLEKRIKYIRSRIARLRSPVGINNCLEMAHKCDDPAAIKGDELDRNPWLFPVGNGVLHLKLGELRKGRAKDYLFKSSPVNFEPNTSCLLWDKTILEIGGGNPDWVAGFQRVCGYSMIGQSIEHVLIVLAGQGRNGKTLILNVLSDIFGGMAAPIRSEMLEKQFRSNAESPSPGIVSLWGLRLAIASETEENCQISPPRVKLLTGNDELTGRLPHDKFPTTFRPSHTLFLSTNSKPHAPAHDYAFWERVLLFPFNISFVNREPETENEYRANLHLYDELKLEYSGILSWLLRGCLAWQQIGLDPPSIVKQAVAEYRRDEDVLADFLNECCVIDESCKAGATELY